MTAFGSESIKSHPLFQLPSTSRGELPWESSVQLLSDCIQAAETEVVKATGKNLVLILGETGSGKTTMLSYLLGCNMKAVSPKSVGATGVASRIVMSADSPLFSRLIIGHTQISETPIPRVISDWINRITYCDFPGFFDNRGPEVNAANAVNIQRIIQAATTIKIILLIQHTNLIDIRQRSLHNTLSITENLFGQALFEKLSASMLIGITRLQYPETLSDLTTNFIDVEKRFGIDFSKRLFICDPINCRRENVITLIRHLPPIHTLGCDVNVVLSDPEKARFLKIGQEVIAQIKMGMDANQIAKIAALFNHLVKLKVIEHLVVARIFEETLTHLDRQFVLCRHLEPQFSSNAPPWRIIHPGLNIESTCRKRWCRAYKNQIWTNFTPRFGVIDLKREAQWARCPNCVRTARGVINIGFYQCQYTFIGDTPFGSKKRTNEVFSAAVTNGFVQFSWREISQLKRFCIVCVTSVEKSPTLEIIENKS